MSSVSRSSQITDGTDATMSGPASRSGASDSCLSKSTGGSDVTMSDLEETAFMGGQLMTGRREHHAPAALSVAELASPAWETR